MLFLGLAVCAFVALCGTALPGALQTQGVRADRLSIVTGERTPDAAALALEPAAVTNRRWNGHEVERVAVAATPSTTSTTLPRDLGVARLPATGEVYVSPALADRLHDDEVLAALLSDYEVVGVIDDTGLVQPRQLRAVIGVAPETAGLLSVVRVGSSEYSAVAAPPAGVDLAVGVLIAVLVAVPTAALVVVSSRLGSRQRAGRVRALRRLGLARREVKVVLAVEVLLVAAPALLVGIVMHQVYAARPGGIPGTDIGFFGGDLQLGAGPACLVVGLLLCLVLASAVLGVRTEERLPGAGSRGVRSRGAVLVLGLGVLTFLGLRWFPDGVVKVLGLWGGFGLLAVGAALSGSPLVSRVSAMATRLPVGGGWLVALRINQHEPGSTVRMASAIGALAVCVTAAVGFLSVLNAAGSPSADGSDGTSMLTVHDFGRVLEPDQVSRLTGVEGAVPLIDVEGDRDTVPAVAATCAELTRLVGAGIDCADSPRWLATAATTQGGVVSTLSESDRAALGGELVSLPPRSATLLLPRSAKALSGTLFVPEATSAGSARGYVVRVDAGQQIETLARISSMAPYTAFETPGGDAGGSDSAEYGEQISWLVLGATISVLIAVLTLTVGGLGEAEARRRRLRGLYVLGAGQRHLALAHGVTMFLPLALVGVMSVALSALAAAGMSLYDDRTNVGPLYFGLLAAASLVAAATVTAATLPSAVRPWSSEDA